MRKTFFIIAALLATGTAAQAAPAMQGMDMSHMNMGSNSHMSMPSTKAQDPMAGLNMDQQMALCSRLETLKKQKSTLTPKMTQQLAACQKMDMGMSSQSAPDETLDR